MSWYALENIEDALQESKEALLPVDFRTWTAFAFIILFTGYVLNPLPTVPSTGTSPDFDSGSPGISDQNVPETSVSYEDFNLDRFAGDSYAAGSVSSLTVIAGLLAVVFLVFLLFVSSVFEFVMYRSVMDKEPRLGYVREYLTEGFQYFMFRVLMLLVSILGLLIGAALVYVNFWLIFVAVPAFVVLFILTSILRWIVFHLVIPNMVDTGKNMLEAFRKSLNAVREELGQVLLFWFVKWVISLALSVIAALALVSFMVMLIIPFGLVGIIAYLISSLLVFPVALAYILVVLLVMVYMAVPLRVYLYNYIFLFYEDLSQ